MLNTPPLNFIRLTGLDGQDIFVNVQLLPLDIKGRPEGGALLAVVYDYTVGVEDRIRTYQVRETPTEVYQKYDAYKKWCMEGLEAQMDKDVGVLMERPRRPMKQRANHIPTWNPLA